MPDQWHPPGICCSHIKASGWFMLFLLITNEFPGKRIRFPLGQLDSRFRGKDDVFPITAPIKYSTFFAQTT
jgi:hypothetical protein